MRPNNEEMLAGLRRALAESLSQEVSSVYGRTQVIYATSLLAAIPREAENAVDSLVRENAALAYLLRAAGAVLKGEALSDAGLAAELAAVETPSTDDLRLSVLRAENGRLLSLLIRLQEACEADLESAAVRGVYAETLSLLRRRNRGDWR